MKEYSFFMYSIRNVVYYRSKVYVYDKVTRLRFVLFEQVWINVLVTFCD